MSKQKLISFLEKRGTLSEEEKVKIDEIFEERFVAKNKMLLHVGEVCNELYFVNKGMLRCFNLTETGNEFTRLFIMENSFGSNFQSYINRIPSLENIQVLEDSEILVINYKDFIEFNDTYQNGMSIYRKILEEFQTFHIKRFEFLTNYESKQRVEKFVKENPELAERVKNKIIASYLNMSPETYSRFRKRLQAANKEVK